MNIFHAGYDWNVCEGDNYLCLPNTANVYMIVFILKGTNEIKVAYVGNTSKIKTRMCCHAQLRKALANKRGHSVNIFYRKFHSNFWKNRHTEKRLIRLLLPPFNNEQRKNILPIVKDFWKELGVIRVRKSEKSQRGVSLKRMRYLNKRKKQSKT